MKGWPSRKEEVLAKVREYWNFCDELVVQDGIIFRRSRLVDPKTLRAEMLNKIHYSHNGIDMCLRKA